MSATQPPSPLVTGRARDGWTRFGSPGIFGMPTPRTVWPRAKTKVNNEPRGSGYRASFRAPTRPGSRRWDRGRYLTRLIYAPTGAILGTVTYYGFHQPHALTELAEQHGRDAGVLLLFVLVPLAALIATASVGQRRPTRRGAAPGGGR